MTPDEKGHVVPTLDHVIGQTRAVAVLRTAINAYFHDRTKATEEQAFPHVLDDRPRRYGQDAIERDGIQGGRLQSAHGTGAKREDAPTGSRLAHDA